MDMYGGIGEFFEDWVERMHQDQKKFDSRGKIRDKQKSADYQCRQGLINNNEQVNEIQNEVTARARRNFKKPRPETSEQKQSIERYARREQAVRDAIELFDNCPTLKSVFDRSMLERQLQLEEERRSELEE
mmetsp:Transcript_30289/g.72624  ORF Transcript_30289/g.72624 Transcript_30289/m.72624 type:complete len:131 (+) Transcript_30289:2-394(+)